MNRVTRDWKLAVVIASDYGGAFYSGDYDLHDPNLRTNRRIVEWVLAWNTKISWEQLIEWYWDEDRYEYSGNSALEVIWVPLWEKYYIGVYDWAEDLIVEDEMQIA